MLVKYMRLVEKEKFAESLTLDVTEILKKNAKLENTLSNLRDNLHKHNESDQIILGSLKKVMDSFREMESMVVLLETNLEGFYNQKEKTILEETMEKLQAISNNKGGLINEN